MQEGVKDFLRTSCALGPQRTAERLRDDSEQPEGCPSPQHFPSKGNGVWRIAQVIELTHVCAQ